MVSNAIEQGARSAVNTAGSDPAVFEVVRFREKPSVALAESFLLQGNFWWNAGMFVRVLLKSEDIRSPSC